VTVTPDLIRGPALFPLRIRHSLKAQAGQPEFSGMFLGVWQSCR